MKTCVALLALFATAAALAPGAGPKPAARVAAKPAVVSAAARPSPLAAAALAAPLALAAEPAFAGPIEGLQSIQIGPLNAFQLIGFSPPLVAVGWGLIIIGPGFIQQFKKLLFPREGVYNPGNRVDFVDPVEQERFGRKK